MAKNPEEVHPNYRRAAGLRIEEMAAEVTVDGQHDLRSGQWANRKYHKHRHYQIEPREQRHSCQRHSRAAQGKNCCNDIDRCTDAAETGDEQAESPEVRAVAE